MHHALIVPDILNHIFSFIKADEQVSQCTFAALAKTCTALSEASLDSLWSELNSLTPLISCIYEKNVKLCDEHDNDAEPDLSVFYKYAYRVRKLELSGYQLSSRIVPYAASVVDDLGAFHVLNVPTPILPNLNHLVWADGLNLPLLWPLLNPRLLSLHIPASQWSPRSTPLFLSKIRGLCPELRSLTLRVCLLEGHQEQAVAERCLSRVISSWEKLEELDCSPVGCEGIISLSMLSSLKVLRLRVTESSVLGLPANSLSFPLLHTFQIKPNSLWGAFSLLRAMKGLPKSIQIEPPSHLFGNPDYDLESVHLILHLIGQNACNTLERFSMTFGGFSESSPVNVSNMLRPLFLCCNLRALRISMMSHFTLLDDDLRAMATAWPLLEELELSDHKEYRVPTPPPVPPLPLHTIGPDATESPPAQHALPYLQLPMLPPAPLLPGFLTMDSWYPYGKRTAEITLHGLISLLELCPNLRFFDLAIDTTKLDGLRGDNPGGGVCNRLIKFSRLVDSPINDPEVVTRILLDILPKLEAVSEPHSLIYDQMLPELLPEGWIQVVERIIALKEVRLAT